MFEKIEEKKRKRKTVTIEINNKHNPKISHIDKIQVNIFIYKLLL